jgi:hypothetical protein
MSETKVAQSVQRIEYDGNDTHGVDTRDVATRSTEARDTQRMRKATLAGLATAALLMCCSLLLATDNPTIKVDVPPAWGYDEFDCLAPYDTVLNDADNSRGGEPPPNIEEISSRCEAAGQSRFQLAIGAGVTGAIVGVGTVAMDLNTRIRRKSRRR